MTTNTNTSRRHFIVGSSAIATGLAIGFDLDELDWSASIFRVDIVFVHFAVVGFRLLESLFE